MNQGRRYLITGGTNGIGRACAAHLTEAGAAVWITGTSVANVTAAVGSGAARGGSVCDVRDDASVNTAVLEAVEGLGGLDGVFANAGIDGAGRPAAELDSHSFQHVLDVNMVGVFRVCRASYRHLARPGTIVVNASVNAQRPEAGFTDYNVSKAAAVALARSLALEWSSEGLSVIALCPGYFPSRMTEQYLNNEKTAAELLEQIPAGRFGDLTEIGATLEFLLGPNAHFMTGGVVTLDGGRSL
ncbi:SDR family NAD(P)-dependent oxidoreductase [Streptomyces sioyaensis]|uniref:SDR family NAD(P)-dependent oxidoreductase n=1 Tax=Streptomyces sioyaensis TaxID=67364 RepID=UPI0037D76EA0